MTGCAHRGRGLANIRRAADADVGGIVSCLHEAFASHRRDYTAAGYADTVLTRETCLQRLQRMCVLVAEYPSGGIVGTVSFEVRSEGDGHLRGMAVRPAWWGTGVAAQLLIEAERQLAVSNCSIVTLDTTAPLERAMAFYRRHGYQRIEGVSDFFGMPLYRFTKALGEESRAVR